MWTKWDGDHDLDIVVSRQRKEASMQPSDRGDDFAAGARGAGTIFVAAWATLIGGTFIGAGILLAKRLADLGSPEESAKAPTPSATGGTVSRRSPSAGERPHAVGG